MAKFEESLSYLAWHYLAQAVMTVYRENQANEADPTQCQFTSNSDAWLQYSAARAEVWQRTREVWCRLTRLGPEWFPYNEDATTRVYCRYRKRGEADLRCWEDEMVAAVDAAGPVGRQVALPAE